MFKELAEAFTIFAKYSDEDYQIGGEHDVLYVYVNPNEVSKEDLERLEALGFEADFEDLENFHYFT